MEAANPPEDISTYVLKENEVKMIRPKYNAETGEFLGLYETVGFMVVRRSPLRSFSTMNTTKTNPGSYTRIIEEGSLTLSEEPYLIGIGQ